MTLAIGILWLSYAVGFYGWNRITGGNDTFLSLTVPGKWKYTVRDSGS
jgi:hypothetical protein